MEESREVREMADGMAGVCEDAPDLGRACEGLLELIAAFLEVERGLVIVRRGDIVSIRARGLAHAAVEALERELRTSLPELVGSAGVMFNPNIAEDIAESVARVWRDDVLIHSMRMMGLERAKLFSWENTAIKTLDAYRRTYELL